MHEIELKAWIENSETAEQRLLRIADFASYHIKTDQYWTINDKTLRIRQTTTNGMNRVFVTQKIKQLHGTMENNQELEFELSVAALPLFTVILEQTGFVLTAQKQKKTKTFIPHKHLFEQSVLQDVQSISAEISWIAPIGFFIEIEVLYPDEKLLTSTDTRCDNARKIIDTLLCLLEIPQSAVETRSYNELLQAAGSLKSNMQIQGH